MSLLATMTPDFHPSIERLKAWPGRFLRSKLFGLIVPVGLFVFWQIASEHKLLPAAIIPAPSQVLESWINWAFGSPAGSLNSYSGSWMASVRASLWRIAQGYAAAVLVGVPAGVLIGRSSIRTQAN